MPKNITILTVAIAAAAIAAAIPAMTQSTSSTLRRLHGKRTYINTSGRIASSDELKRRNGLGGHALDFRLIRHEYQPRARPATSA